MTLSLLSTDMKPVSVDRTIIDGVSQGMLGSSASPYFAQLLLPTHTYDDAQSWTSSWSPVALERAISTARNRSWTGYATGWMTRS